METKEKTTRRLRPLLPLLPPVLLSLLFYLFRGRQALMDGWVIHVMAPAEQLLGRLSAPLPFSLAEVLVTVWEPRPSHISRYTEKLLATMERAMTSTSTMAVTTLREMTFFLDAICY